ncbi:hypothetical protein Pla110_22680 [Polystyrenella longa]|uniref:Uncharacterized protein n=1 Tax=Polystyrenella longa TaxID=2528007 RepID=A0A518CMT1_9PLAN|nr:hypothetical protein [Polystyrenella longa]QDU80537.1 hypothetical protein Pla110_22680 [Polystyrenella longa]
MSEHRTTAPRVSLYHELVLPILLFAAMGGMSWAVRGSSGYGGSWGCTFAGLLWGTGWWYLSHNGNEHRDRRYASNWVILAFIVGFAFSGARGWAQWPNFFHERLYTNSGAGEFVEIDRWYGFLWLFIAGMPWAGLAACLVAWCGSIRETRLWHWLIRLACGFGSGAVMLSLFETFPEWFLPLYDSLELQYQDLENNPSLGRLINDSREAVWHLAIYAGFLLFEIGRRDWKNVTLISTIGIVGGCGWSLIQNWKWAETYWDQTSFNWWRCSESSQGLIIGLGYGIAWFLVNRPMNAKEQEQVTTRTSISGPNFEWLVVFGLLSWIVAVFIINIPTLETVGIISISIWMLTALAYYLFYRGTYQAQANLPNESPRQFGKFDCPAICYTAVIILAAILLAGPLHEEESTYLHGMLFLVVLGSGSLGWYWLKRSDYENAQPHSAFPLGDRNIENWGLYLSLITGLSISIRSGLKGWLGLHWGNQEYWSELFWQYFLVIYPTLLLVVGLWFISRKPQTEWIYSRIRKPYIIIWLVLLVQNVLAQLVTGPHSSWSEFAFSAYYILLFVISMLVVNQTHCNRRDLPGSLRKQASPDQ